MSAPRKNRGQGGSAYLLALLALLALTGVGIALSRVAQTERQLGSSFQTRVQAMNAAESGVAVAEVRLVESDLSDPFEFVFGALAVDASPRRGQRVIVETVTPVAFTPCNLCEMGSGSRWLEVDYTVTATGERRSWEGTSSARSGRLEAAFSIETTLTLQPWRLDETLFQVELPEEASP